ncbi:MAG TPA: aromatic ring-opening dioxygenase LigA [Acidimicrobiia bacterium]|nr:aromatic ring-opening dioxygenase LigA [Acidimicrobiia bacterium]
MKKLFPILLVVLGVVFIGASAYTVTRGFDAKDQVRDELIAQDITTPEDASIPNARVDDPATAKSMADIINKHSLEATGGKTYAQLDREDPNRPTALTAANLRTSLYTSVMAFNVSDLVIGVGLMIGVLGVALAGVGIALGALVIPSLARRAHVHPVIDEVPAAPLPA